MIETKNQLFVRRRNALLSYFGIVAGLFFMAWLNCWIVDNNYGYFGSETNGRYLPQSYRDYIVGIELGHNYTRMGFMRNGTFEIIPDTQGRTSIPYAFDQSFSEKEGNLAMALQDLKSLAEEYLNTTISHAVIAMQDDVSNNQKQTIKNAGELAGLEVIGIINKSTAAGIAYRLDQSKDERVFLVYNADDQEMSLVSIDRGMFELLASVSRGDVWLLKLEAEEVSTQILVHQRMKTLLDLTEMSRDQVDDIILSGDSSQATGAQAVLESFFGKKVQPPVNFTTDQAVVYGAAIQGTVFLRADEYYGDGCAGFLLDVSRLDLGIETSTGDFVHVIPRNTVIPTRKTITVTTAEHDQDAVTMRVLEGVRGNASTSQELDILRLVGLPRLPKGVLRIEVTFELDANDILVVYTRYKEGPDVEEHVSDRLFIGKRDYSEDNIERMLAGNNGSTEAEGEQDSGGDINIKDGVDIVPKPEVEEKVGGSLFSWNSWRSDL